MELPILAPEKEILKQYRQDKDWSVYEAKYLQLLRDRCISGEVDEALFDEGAVLLCAESTPDKCHRRLAAEYQPDRRVDSMRYLFLYNVIVRSGA